MKKYPIIILGLKPFLLFSNQNILLGKKSSLNSTELARNKYDNQILIGFLKPEFDITKISEYTIEHIENTVLIADIIKSSTMEIKQIDVIGKKRATINNLNLDHEQECYMAQYEEFKEDQIDIIVQEQIIYLITNSLKPINQLNSEYTNTIKSFLNNHEMPFNEKILKICNQLLTDTSSIYDRSMSQIIDFLFDNINQLISTIKFKISLEEKTKEKINQKQYKFWAQEQMGILQNEMEDGDGSNKTWKKKILNAKLPKHVEEIALEEYEKLKEMPGYSSEAAVIRNYLKWIVDLPWNISSTDNFEFNKVQQILDESHFGMKKTKEKIIDFLSLHTRTNKINPIPILLYGLPGTGKTSVAESIAKAMNREFVTISLAGLLDSNKLRGQSRTYVGAMPGDIIRKIKLAKTNNPVILLNEVDKLGKTERSPMNVLHEILDPDFNKNFEDNYLDITFDLSQVLFVLSANDIGEIPYSILNRCECIEVESYNNQEKHQIFHKHILPKQLTKYNIRENEITFEDEAIKTLIKKYTKEAGVRKLTSVTKTIVSKAIKKLFELNHIVINNIINDFGTTMTNEEKSLIVNINKHIEKENINDNKRIKEYILSQSNNKNSTFINNVLSIINQYKKEFVKSININNEFIKNNLQYIISKDLAEENYVGLVRGLVYSQMGGDITSIEIVMYPGNEEIVICGHMERSMTESFKNAIAYIKSVAIKLEIPESFFKNKTIHVNTWGAATPKDGPSAGCAFATAVISYCKNLPIPNNVAITGEISLQGRSLLVGGIKEKCDGAFKTISEYTNEPIHVFIPYNIPEYMTENTYGININRVKHIKEIWKTIWPNTQLFQNL